VLAGDAGSYSIDAALSTVRQSKAKAISLADLGHPGCKPACTVAKSNETVGRSLADRGTIGLQIVQKLSSRSRFSP